MKISKIALSLILITSLAGCATQKQWELGTENKAAGTVQLTYTQGQFDNASSSDEQGLAVATERCKSWGYKTAVAQGAEKSVCETMGKFQCLVTIVTKNYQCKK